MSDKTMTLVRRTACIATAACVVACAVAFAIACVGIYQSGNRPFTPERIGAAWQSVAIFFYLTLVLAIGNGVLHLLYPAPVSKKKERIAPALRLAKIKERLARKQYSAEQLAPLAKQERSAKHLHVSAIAVCVLCAIYPLIYLNHLDNFTSIDTLLNAQVLGAVIPTLICTAIALTYCCIIRAVTDASCEKAIVYAKSIMLLPAPAAERKPSGKHQSELPDYTIFVLRIALLIVAVAMIIAGIFNGGVQDVLQKAIKICTECIGLG